MTAMPGADIRDLLLAQPARARSREPRARGAEPGLSGALASGLFPVGCVVAQSLPRFGAHDRFDLSACQANIGERALIEAAEQDNARSPGPVRPIGAPEFLQVLHDPETKPARIEVGGRGCKCAERHGNLLCETWAKTLCMRDGAEPRRADRARRGQASALAPRPSPRRPGPAS